MRGLGIWFNLCPVKLHVDDNHVGSCRSRGLSEKWYDFRDLDGGKEMRKRQGVSFGCNKGFVPPPKERENG